MFESIRFIARAVRGHAFQAQRKKGASGHSVELTTSAKPGGNKSAFQNHPCDKPYNGVLSELKAKQNNLHNNQSVALNNPEKGHGTDRRKHTEMLLPEYYAIAEMKRLEAEQDADS